MNVPVPDWVFNLSPPQVRVLESILVALLLLGLRAGIMHFVGNRVKEVRSRLAWRQTVTFTLLFVGTLLLIRIWFVWFQSIITLLSVVAAAIVIVSKELIANFTSSAVIMWRGLFEVGDRIEIGKTTGDVIEIGLFYITLAEIDPSYAGGEVTGRTVKIPNSTVLNTNIANFSRGLDLLWHEATISVALDKNWQHAKHIAEEVVAEHATHITEAQRRKLLKSSNEIMYTGPSSLVYLKLAGDKVELTLRYLCKIQKRRGTEDLIWSDLLARFVQAGDILPLPKKEDKEKKDGAQADKDSSKKDK